MAQAAAVKQESENKNQKPAKSAAAALYQPELCPRCGDVVIETHCKVICTNCGYMRDCNDQW